MVLINKQEEKMLKKRMKTEKQYRENIFYTHYNKSKEYIVFIAITFLVSVLMQMLAPFESLPVWFYVASAGLLLKKYELTQKEMYLSKRNNI